MSKKMVKPIAWKFRSGEPLQFEAVSKEIEEEEKPGKVRVVYGISLSMGIAGVELFWLGRYTKMVRMHVVIGNHLDRCVVGYVGPWKPLLLSFTLEELNECPKESEDGYAVCIELDEMKKSASIIPESWKNMWHGTLFRILVDTFFKFEGALEDNMRKFIELFLEDPQAVSCLAVEAFIGLYNTEEVGGKCRSDRHVFKRVQCKLNFIVHPGEKVKVIAALGGRLVHPDEVKIGEMYEKVWMTDAQPTAHKWKCPWDPDGKAPPKKGKKKAKAKKGNIYNHCFDDANACFLYDSKIGALSAVPVVLLPVCMEGIELIRIPKIENSMKTSLAIRLEKNNNTLSCRGFVSGQGEEGYVYIPLRGNDVFLEVPRSGSVCVTEKWVEHGGFIVDAPLKRSFSVSFDDRTLHFPELSQSDANVRHKWMTLEECVNIENQWTWMLVTRKM